MAVHLGGDGWDRGDIGPKKWAQKVAPENLIINSLFIAAVFFQAYSISPDLKESPPVSPLVQHSEAGVEVEVVITEKCKS